MDAEQREQVRDMVSAMLGEALKPVLRAQAETRERLIGIDGNGTGREGVLQRQDKKLEEMSGQLAEVKDGQALLLTRSESWSKKAIWEFAQWVIGGAGALGAAVAGMWLGHVMGWIH